MQSERIHSDLAQLFFQPESLRDKLWETNVLNWLPFSSAQLLNEAPQNGPDGWPYLMVEINESTQNQQPMKQILFWLTENGVGLVINPYKYAPDMILPYGMIWNFRQTGQFTQPLAPLQQSGDPFILESGSNINWGEPSLEYWPIYSRKIVCEFLAQQGIHEPKTLVISQDGKHYDLCFSTQSFGNPHDKDHHRILESLSWFFPSHYSLVLISEQNLPKFQPILNLKN